MRCTKTNDKENKKPVVHQYLSRVKDWINLVFVVKTFILGRCYGK